MGFSDMIQGDAEFIPVLSQEDEDEIEEEAIPEILPILPLRNAVLFPGIVTPITVGREKSLALIKEVNKGNKILGCLAQKDVAIEEPELDDLYKIGTVAKIIKMLNMPDGSTTVIIQGRRRFQIEEIISTEPYDIAKVTARPNTQKAYSVKQFEALVSALKDIALQVIKKSPIIPSDASFAVQNIESNNYLVNFVCSNLNTDVVEKQFALEYDEMQDRAEYILKSLSRELQVLDLKNKIHKKVKVDLDKQQRDYLLHQQMKTIKEELGDASSNEQELDALRKKAKKKKWSKDISDVFEKEYTKLQRMNPSAMEYSIQMNYLEVLVDLPWGEFTKDNFDLDHAQKILDRDHYGLKEVKERIIEYLAVLKLKNDMKSPIICLVGPPGVGKTSLGKSIAEALGRKYIRMSLGGMRDESEIRGHRKTYIGALPGRLIQNLKKVKSSNPVFVLDEIDKVASSTVNGDPASALLEVLDPEQNSTFHDNFLEVEYDLSNIMFVATANTISTIHPALRDRMEMIDV
ncbi:MAG: LON peptidase substrate-binding domain-containing protein, partial [Bacteroidota bacterium]|nr:LON peptidase substrate-binding domain-containing protein [Bacteroidota bacterium]